MDNAFSRPFPGFTLVDLKTRVAAGVGSPAIVAEVTRREAVAAGDVSQMYPSERLRAARKQ